MEDFLLISLKTLRRTAAAGFLLISFVAGLPAQVPPPGLEEGVVKHSDGGEFFTNAIPSVARLSSGKLLAVWSAAGKSKRSSRIVAALSEDDGRTWAEPRSLIQTEGMNDTDPNILVDGTKIFVYSTSTPAHMKLITGSKVFMVESKDDARTWSAPVRINLPYAYFVGKIHNGLKLLDGTLAMGFSWDLWAQKGIPARTEGEMNLASGVLLSHDGIHWTPYGQVHAWPEKITPYSTGGLCEPAIVQLLNGDLLMVLRAGAMFHYESRSHDGGLTWDPPKVSTIIGHNNPVALWRLENRRDEIVAVFDNSAINRYPLSVAISADGGRYWSKPRDIAAPHELEVSYPNITQARDGAIVTVWQEQLVGGGRDVRWARFTRAWVLGEQP
jgi:predicted neuraminidase